MRSVVTVRGLGGVMVGILAQNARDEGSIPTLGPIFCIFIMLHDTGCCDHDPVQAMY